MLLAALCAEMHSGCMPFWVHSHPGHMQWHLLDATSLALPVNAPAAAVAVAANKLCAYRHTWPLCQYLPPSGAVPHALPHGAHSRVTKCLANKSHPVPSSWPAAHASIQQQSRTQAQASLLLAISVQPPVPRYASSGGLLALTVTATCKQAGVQLCNDSHVSPMAISYICLHTKQLLS